MIFRKNPRLKTLCLDPTYECPLNCPTCNSNSIAKSFKEGELLEYKDYENIIDQFTKMKGSDIEISGGEPLLREDIFHIIRYAKDKGLKVSMFTNALLLNEERSKELLNTGIDLLRFSLEGVGERYDLIRGKGTFAKFLLALKTFLRIKKFYHDNKPEMEFRVTVSRYNASHLADILFLAQELGIDHIVYQYLSRVDPRENLRTEEMLKGPFMKEINHWDLPSEILVAPDQLRSLREEVKKIKTLSEKLYLYAHIDPVLDSRFNEFSITTGRFILTKRCYVLWNSIIIEPDGKIAPCPMLTHFPISNIKECHLRDFWLNNKRLNFIRGTLLKEKYLPICYYCCRHVPLM
ncbi:PqqA peptide cyclase [subsurface metagenome]